MRPPTAAAFAAERPSLEAASRFWPEANFGRYIFNTTIPDRTRVDGTDAEGASRRWPTGVLSDDGRPTVAVSADRRPYTVHLFIASTPKVAETEGVVQTVEVS